MVEKNLKNKKILYLHGLGSGEMARTAILLKLAFSDVAVYAPELPVSPKKAVETIKRIVKIYKPDVVVGSSLGGFYASCINKSIPTVMVNPALQASDNILKAFGLGEQEFRANRKDGAKTYVIDENYINELIELEHSRDFDVIINQNVHAIFGLDDELFSNAEFFQKHYAFGKDKRTLVSGMGHHLSNEDIQKYVIPLVKKALADKKY